MESQSAVPGIQISAFMVEHTDLTRLMVLYGGLLKSKQSGWTNYRLVLSIKLFWGGIRHLLENWSARVSNVGEGSLSLLEV